MKKENKIRYETYEAHELGLPILIKNAPIIEIEGHEVIDIDYTKISEVLFNALILKPTPLLGREVRFIRLFMGLTLEAFANKLQVTHPTVLAWERMEDREAKITSSTEAMLRILAAKQGLEDSELAEVILNRFFESSRNKYCKEEAKTPIIGVELDSQKNQEPPKIHFISEEDLEDFQEA